jgi:hypothetical protein
MLLRGHVVFHCHSKLNERPAMSSRGQYDAELRDALEQVFVIAARRGLDIGQLAAEFDSGRQSGFHDGHTMTISIRDTSIAVTASLIPHSWLSTGTGFIDARFSRKIAGLLSDLETTAKSEGRII